MGKKLYRNENWEENGPVTFKNTGSQCPVLNTDNGLKIKQATKIQAYRVIQSVKWKSYMELQEASVPTNVLSSAFLSVRIKGIELR